MSLCQDIRDVVSGFINPFTTQDVVDAFPGYNSLLVKATFRNLVCEEDIAENISLLTNEAVYVTTKGTPRTSFDSKRSHPVIIDGISFPTMAIGCKAFKLKVAAVRMAFSEATSKLKTPALTITYHGHTITRSHN